MEDASGRCAGPHSPGGVQGRHRLPTLHQARLYSEKACRLKLFNNNDKEPFTVNLTRDPWLTVRDGAGAVHRISPLDIGDPRYQELVAPRPDFRGAGVQFLLGLLQLAYPPTDVAMWRERLRTPPDASALQAAFAEYAHAFELQADGPAFMQDLQLPADANQVSVLNLLIDAGSDSNLFFNKPVEPHGMCQDCFAQALLALQINAPSGGRGTRVSVRGGGPMTTLLLPAQEACTLWQKLWLNVLPSESLGYPAVRALGDVLPWLVPTRISEGAAAVDTTPLTVHPLQAYWSMPRRIRLDPSTLDTGDCAVCGAAGVTRIRHYRTRHGGTNYTGAWLHPLTPYSLDPKGEAPPLSIKGQPGGIGYRHWLGLALGRADHQPDAARVVSHFQAKVRRPAVRLWCFGYDMSNMKARCWYDSTLPVHVVDDSLRVAFMKHVKALIDVASDAAGSLHKQVKAARFRRPAEAGSEPAVYQSFWEKSEPDFYRVLEQLAHAELDSDAAIAPLYRDWLLRTRRIALELFEHWTLAGSIEDRDLKRVVKARAALSKELNQGKHAKPLWKIVNTHLKEAA